MLKTKRDVEMNMKGSDIVERNTTRTVCGSFEQSRPMLGRQSWHQTWGFGGKAARQNVEFEGDESESVDQVSKWSAADLWMSSSSEDEALALIDSALPWLCLMKLKGICVVRSTKGSEDRIRIGICFPSPELQVCWGRRTFIQQNDFWPNFLECPLFKYCQTYHPNKTN